MSAPAIPELLTAIRTILNQARTQLQNTVNHTMVHTYWQVGHLIVEHEQKGEIRASYGQQQIKTLSEFLSEFLFIIIFAVYVFRYPLKWERPPRNFRLVWTF